MVGLFIFWGACGIVIDLAVMIIGSTAPFTAADNHGLDYRSGMLQSWNKFCFTTGYIEVSVTFPGPDQNTQGYVSFFFFGFSISSSGRAAFLLLVCVCLACGGGSVQH